MQADGNGRTKVRKSWFTREGKLDRVTGSNENPVIPVKTPPNNSIVVS